MWTWRHVCPPHQHSIPPPSEMVWLRHTGRETGRQTQEETERHRRKKWEGHFILFSQQALRSIIECSIYQLSHQSSLGWLRQLIMYIKVHSLTLPWYVALLLLLLQPLKVFQNTLEPVELCLPLQGRTTHPWRDLQYPATQVVKQGGKIFGGSCDERELSYNIILTNKWRCSWLTVHKGCSRAVCWVLVSSWQQSREETLPCRVERAGGRHKHLLECGGGGGGGGGPLYHPLHVAVMDSQCYMHI